ncbi:MAG TPA: NAD(P)H-hydrate dehydratase [Chthoniobacterales bacterium]|nr:NAD(P)H-hydrate dehydratase [Chthoniobacterales bacterium]
MESPVLSSAQMQAAEQAAFARGITVEALMNQAGAGVARAVRQFFPKPATCIVFAGKGHNGGDALVAAEQLQRIGWKIDVRLPFAEDNCSELTQKKLKALREATPKSSDTIDRATQTIILDGLLGTGAKSFLREPIRSAAREINRLHRENNAFVFAVDLPTGLDADSGENDPEDSVVADFTVTIGFVKHGLIVDPAINFVGRIEIVPLTDLWPDATAPNELAANAHSLSAILPRRKFSAYKNQFGRIGVVAGSRGFVGAAIMTAEGALRAGAGLVEVFVPEEIYEIVASDAPIEAMVKPVRRYRDLLDEKVNVWAVGPGLGKARAGEVLNLIENASQPMIVDADGLNIVADKIDILRSCRGPRLLTPHPGEMSRLMDVGKMARAGIARNFCDRFPVTLLLKGSRTIVCERGKPISYNTTGNPGMASGGMGDVLTGVCAGLAGRELSMYDAGRVGTWVCGRAAEMSIFQKRESEESLLAGNVLAHLGAAFNELRDPSV